MANPGMEMNIQTVKKAEEKADQKTRVSNWMIALGIGVGAGLVTAAAVYYVKKQRSTKPSRYQQEPTIEGYQSRFRKYWNLTVSVCNTVRNTVSAFLSKDKPMAPLVAGGDVFLSPFDSESEQPVVLGENDF